MKNRPAKIGKHRLPVILAGVFFLFWAVAVIFTVGETFSRTGSDETAVGATPALPAGPGGASGRYPILDRRGGALAVSFPVKSVYARPLEVDDPGAASSFLSQALELDEKQLQRQLREELGFFWVGRQVPEAAGEKIQERNLPGIYVVDESQRYYPRGRLAAHVLGFTGEGHGLAGIEARYDRQLRGLTDALGQEAEAGAIGPLVLTLDPQSQELLEKRLAELIQTTSADWGCGLLLEAGTGGILALTSQPGYDPNFFWEYDESARVNRAAAIALPVPGFQGLFRLAALFQNGPRLGPGEAGVAPEMTALKNELKLARVIDRRAGRPAGLVRQGERYLSPPLVDLAELEEARDFAGFMEGLRPGRKLFAESEAGATEITTAEEPGLTGLALIAGLAALINPVGAVTPHLVAGVRDESSGRLLPRAWPAVPVLGPAAAEKVRAYWQGMIRAGEGVAVLEELTPVSVGTGLKLPGDRNPETDRYTSVVVGLAGEGNSPLLLLLALGKARLNPATDTPTRLAAVELLPRLRTWAAEEPAAPVWQPEEHRWWAEWLRRQAARAGKMVPTEDPDRRKMPDLNGLSLRKALQTLNRYGLEIRVQGSGRVASQQPGAGTLIDGGECVLVLADVKAR